MPDCEHIDINIELGMQAGKCRCDSCGKVMFLSEGLNYMFKAMRKRIVDFEHKIECLAKAKATLMIWEMSCKDGKNKQHSESPHQDKGSEQETEQEI